MDSLRVSRRCLLSEYFSQSVILNKLISTIIYVVLGQLGERLLHSSNPQVKVSLPKREAPKSPKPTAGAKQAKVRKTAAKGEWLTTKKRKSTERKPAAKKKTKVSKKAPPKTNKTRKSKSQSKARSDALDVIEILSDESDSKPSPLVTRDTNLDDDLWNGSEDDEEYEFDG